MVKFNERQKKTLKYLSVSTVICWISLWVAKYLEFFNIVVFLVPLIFGVALYYSNKNYLRNKSSIVIPFLFAIVYYWGTSPFYNLANLFTESGYLNWVFGCMAAFSFVFLIVKVGLSNVQVGIIQILMILVLPFICIALLAFLKGQTISTMQSYMFDRYDLVVLLYQFFMILIIVSSLGINRVVGDGNL